MGAWVCAQLTGLGETGPCFLGVFVTATLGSLRTMLVGCRSGARVTAQYEPSRRMLYLHQCLTSWPTSTPPYLRPNVVSTALRVRTYDPHLLLPECSQQMRQG